MMCAYFCIVAKQYLCSDTKYFCHSKHPLLHDSSKKNIVNTSKRNLYMCIRKCEKISVQKVYKSSFVTHKIKNCNLSKYSPAILVTIHKTDKTGYTRCTLDTDAQSKPILAKKH